MKLFTLLQNSEVSLETRSQLEFRDSWDDGQGGIAYLENSTLRIHSGGNLTVSNCSAANNGGFISHAKGGNLSILSGENIRVEKCSSLQGGVFSLNQIGQFVISAEKDMTFSYNQASNLGGVFYL